jgi:hypothetical protein
MDSLISVRLKNRNGAAVRGFGCSGGVSPARWPCASTVPRGGKTVRRGILLPPRVVCENRCGRFYANGARILTRGREWPCTRREFARKSPRLTHHSISTGFNPVQPSIPKKSRLDTSSPIKIHPKKFIRHQILPRVPKTLDVLMY